MGAIAEVYQQTRKRPDLFWNTYVCRPLAAVVVVAVRNTRVTPNQITLSALWVASAAAAMFVAVPGYWGLLLGAIVFELSYVLDCADGMLARLRGVQSQGGHLLDFLMDELKAYLLVAALAGRWHLHDGGGVEEAPPQEEPEEPEEEERRAAPPRRRRKRVHN